MCGNACRDGERQVWNGDNTEKIPLYIAVSVLKTLFCASNFIVHQFVYSEFEQNLIKQKQSGFLR